MSGVRKCDVRGVIEDSARDGKSVFGSLCRLGEEPRNRGTDRGQSLHVAAQFPDPKRKLKLVKRKKCYIDIERLNLFKIFFECKVSTLQANKILMVEVNVIHVHFALVACCDLIHRSQG